MSRPGAGRGSGDHGRGGRRYPYRGGDRYRHGHRPHRAPREPRATHRRAEPAPEGDRCSPVCPLFVCSKRALIVKLENGRPIAYCSWAGDRCIGATCQYASCKLHSQLPDGRCAQALRRHQHHAPSFEEDLESSSRASTSVRSLISRRGLDKDLESELF